MGPECSVNKEKGFTSNLFIVYLQLNKKKT